MSDVELVIKTADLLRGLALHEPTGATTSELARSSGMSRSTAHRILGTLYGRGLVDRHVDTGLWLLGPETFLLGTTCAPRYDLRALSGPVVRRLADDTGESAHLSVRRGDESVCLLREDGSFPLRSHVLYEGIRLPLGVASAGLAILAFLDEHERDEYLERVDLTVEHGAAHERQLVESRLQQAREDGYALHPGLLVQGSWGMGAAVFSAAGAPIAALSLTGVEQRFGPDRQPLLGAKLMRAAHALSSALAVRTEAAGGP
jgi:DNA-binding IclR family transcriptional regulator